MSVGFTVRSLEGGKEYISVRFIVGGLVGSDDGSTVDSNVGEILNGLSDDDDDDGLSEINAEIVG